MSLADEVLEIHQRRECFCGCGDVGCPLCGDGWPCESFRLATSLRAAKKVVEIARDWHEGAEDCECEDGPHMSFDGIIDPKRCGLGGALAEYDKGGQG